MSDVRKVFITREVAAMTDRNSAYLIRVAKEIGLSESEFRDAGKRNYLFSEEAVVKLKKHFGDK